jgi:dTDP-D-glucose 4,6-dehydratase
VRCRPGSAALANPAGLEATNHKALISRINVDSHTAQTIGSPAAQITTNITGTNGKLTRATNRLKCET